MSFRASTRRAAARTPWACGWSAVILLAACGHAGLSMPRPATAVTGYVTYRERLALPPDAEVRVMLLDVSRMDAAAAPVADTTIRPGGRQVPLPFVLRFDRDRIDPRHDYAVRATITAESRLMFTTTAVIRVITRDHPTMIDLVLSHVGPEASGTPPTAAGPAPSPAGLWGTSWVLEDVAGAGVIDNARATLDFLQQGRAAGRGSCNRFSGGVTVTGDRIAFEPLISTRMACAEAVMNQERKYLEMLQAAERYQVDGSYLLIYAKNVDRPLRFTRVTTP